MKPISNRTITKRLLVMIFGATVFLSPFNSLGEESLSVTKAPKHLLAYPCLTRPTASTMTINIVAAEKPIDCFIRYREAQTQKEISWKQTATYAIDANTPTDILLESLSPGTIYTYQVHVGAKGSGAFESVTGHYFRTRRIGNVPFSFAMISDAHITAYEPNRLKILSEVSASVLARKPDFILMLGDNIQTFTSHGGPMTEARFGPMLYTLLRWGLGNLTASVPVFNVMGNWEGENGWHSEEQRAWARDARMAWIPNPLPGTYPEGGNSYGDFYGFSWGNTLNLILTVTGYTTIDHVLNAKIGKADDWTLGDKQKAWLHQQLSASNAKWKFLFIHHTLGGNAGTDADTRYGRGGGRAAYIGEQRQIHEWMKQSGVKAFFYGHDHVFTDIAVDGIHYICVGSAGAPWKFTQAETGYERYWPESGYTWVDVHADKLHVSFITPDVKKPAGKVLHQIEIK